jgi:hypothetical protein
VPFEFYEEDDYNEGGKKTVFYVNQHGVSIQMSMKFDEKLVQNNFNLDYFKRDLYCAAPPHWGTRLLYQILHFFILEGFATITSKLTLRALQSESGNLIKKVYRPMGFVKLDGGDDENGGPMISTFRNLLRNHTGAGSHRFVLQGEELHW